MNDIELTEQVKKSIYIMIPAVKYALTSLSSSLIDLAVFYALNNWVFGGLSLAANVTASSLIARAISSLYNFTMNRRVVFHAQSGSLAKQIGAYYALVVAQILCSTGLVYLFTSLLKLPATIVKVVVDTFLFLVSYKIQSSWLFKDKAAGNK